MRFKVDRPLSVCWWPRRPRGVSWGRRVCVAWLPAFPPTAFESDRLGGWLSGGGRVSCVWFASAADLVLDLGLDLGDFVCVGVVPGSGSCG